MQHVMIVGAHCGDGEIQAGAIAHKYAQAAGTCLVEGMNLSEGSGTTQPFEIIGAPFIDGGNYRIT